MVVIGSRCLLEEDVVTLLNASDNEEDILEEENHTSDDSIHPTSESECDTSDSEDDSDNVQSKNRKITLSVEPFPQHGRTSSANIIKLTPGPTRYATSRTDDIRSSFQVIMNNNLSDIVLKMTNIEGRRVYGDNWENLDAITLEAYIGILL